MDPVLSEVRISGLSIPPALDPSHSALNLTLPTGRDIDLFRKSLWESIQTHLPTLERALVEICDRTDYGEYRYTDCDPRSLSKVGRCDVLWSQTCCNACQILGLLLRRDGWNVQQHSVFGLSGDDLIPFPFYYSDMNGHALLLAEREGLPRIIIDPSYRQFTILHLDRPHNQKLRTVQDYASDLPRDIFSEAVLIMSEDEIGATSERIGHQIGELGDRRRIIRDGKIDDQMIIEPFRRLWDLSQYNPLKPTPEELLQNELDAERSKVLVSVLQSL